MRKSLFKWHSYLALFAMLPVLIVCITGSILVFKVEIDSLLRPHHMVVNANQTSARVNLDSMMTSITQSYPEHVLAGWELFDDKSRSDTAYVIKKGTETWYKIYIDQYSGALLSEPKEMEHYITDWLLELHYAFLLHFNGTIIGVFVGLIMLFLGISGIILYRGFWRKVFTLRLKAARRMLFSDIHKMVGIIASPVFILISFTGVYWNLSIILHEVLEHVEKEHVFITQSYHSATISFEALRLDTANQISSYQPYYMAIPNEPEMDITFFGKVDTSNPLISEYASMVTYSRDTGKLITAYDIRSASVWAKFDDSTRKLHFGYFAGIWSKVIWCIIGLSPVLLAITGLLMYLLRRSPKKQRRVRSLDQELAN
jgi:uncharacterized iron-regulated membrane protein